MLFKYAIGVILLLFVICKAEAQELPDFKKQLEFAEGIKSSDPDNFSKILNEIQPHLDKISIYQRYYYLYLSGYRSAFNGKIDAAIENYQHVEQNSQDVELKYKASLSLVNLYALKQDWGSGYRYLEVLTNSFDDVANTEVRHHGLAVAAFFYSELELYDMVDIYTQRLFLEDVQGRSRCVGFSMKLRSDLFHRRLDDLMAQYGQAIDICTSVGEHIVNNIIRTYVAEYRLSNQQPDEAAKLLESRYSEIVSQNYTLLTLETQNLLATAYHQSGQEKLARHYAKLVVDTADPTRYVKILINSYMILTEIERAAGNSEVALNYLSLAASAKEILFEQTRARQLAIESAKHRTQEKDWQIDLLNKQNQILRLESDNAQQISRYQTWLSISLAVMTLVTMIWLLSVKFVHKRNKRMITFDPVTGLPDASTFNRLANIKLQYLEKEGRPVSLALLRVNNLNQIDQDFGHSASDKVLNAIGRYCDRQLYSSDLLARSGRNKFVVVLPDRDLQAAAQVCEELYQQISLNDNKLINSDVNLTLTTGYASGGYNLESLLKLAEDSLS